MPEQSRSADLLGNGSYGWWGSFSARLSVLGLMTMLGVAHAPNDPLVHTDEALLKTLISIFDGTVQVRSTS